MTKEEIKIELKALNVPFNEDDNYGVLNALLLKSKTHKVEPIATPTIMPEVAEGTPEKRYEFNDEIKINRKEWEDVQKQLKMLYEVADKNRVQNYESQRAEKKPFKVKLSVFDGKIIVGWQTKRDELIRDPRTGTTIGEKQEIEIRLLDNDGNLTNAVLDGYVSFSNARYGERIDAEVINRKEDYNGNTSFDVKLPNGRTITLDARFVN